MVYSWKRTLTVDPAERNALRISAHACQSQTAPRLPSMPDLGCPPPTLFVDSSDSVHQRVGYFSIGDNPLGLFVRNGFEFNNRTSWMKGKHSMQFGGEAQYYKAHIKQRIPPPELGGLQRQRHGNAMADFMLGDMRTFDQGTGEYKENRVLDSSAFFQDDYKVHPRLSLNIGARYEPTPPWHEVVGRIQIFRLDAYHQGLRSTQFDNAPPGSFFRGDPGVPEDGTLGDYNNVGFRGGAAWDLTGDGKTSLRGGWGMFYDQHIRGGSTTGPSTRRRGASV